MAEQDSLLERAYGQFGVAAGWAGLYELRVRFLANKERKTSRDSFSHSFGYVLDAVIVHHLRKGRFTPENVKFLKQAKKVRDKLLHSEFRALINVVEETIGQKLSGPSVRHTNDISGPNALEKLEQFIKGESGQSVGEMPFKAIGHFGYFLEAVWKDAILTSTAILKTAVSLIDRTSADHANLKGGDSD